MEKTLVLDLSKIDVQDELYKIIETQGEEYREIQEPVDIEILTEEREIPASTMDWFYSDGYAPNRIVPAGTIVVLPNNVITEEEFNNDYEQYLDNEGNEIPGKYTKINIVKAMQNPFAKNIERINPNGFVIEKFDSECYFLTGHGLQKVNILPKDLFIKFYEPYNSNNKKQNNSIGNK